MDADIAQTFLILLQQLQKEFFSRPFFSDF